MVDFGVALLGVAGFDSVGLLEGFDSIEWFEVVDFVELVAADSGAVVCSEEGDGYFQEWFGWSRLGDLRLECSGRGITL